MAPSAHTSSGRPRRAGPQRRGARPLWLARSLPSRRAQRTHTHWLLAAACWRLAGPSAPARRRLDWLPHALCVRARALVRSCARTSTSQPEWCPLINVVALVRTKTLAPAPATGRTGAGPERARGKFAHCTQHDKLREESNNTERQFAGCPLEHKTKLIIFRAQKCCALVSRRQ